MEYIFDIYRQEGETPSVKDTWLGRRYTTYFEIAKEVNQMNDLNDCNIYFIRV